MGTSGWIRLSCVALLAFVAARFYLAYDQLPDLVPTHFDHAGRADGYGGKASFARYLVTFQAMLTIAPLPFLYWLPRSSVKNINLPHAKYYLAPARRPGTLRRLARMAEWAVLGLAVQLALLAELTVRAQLAGGPMPISPILPTGLYAVFGIAIAVRTFRAFPPPPAE